MSLCGQNSLFVVGRGFTLRKRDRIHRAGGETISQTVAVILPEKGGFAVHYNVLDSEILKAARKDPSAYPNLQVRLCGWNVLFASLSDREKDEFIARFEKG